MRGDAGYAYLPAGQADAEFAKYETRIKALERQCAALAAQADRQAKVVEVAQVLSRSLRRHDPASWSGTEEALERMVTEYEAAMAQLAKDGKL
jgi:predicted ATPase